MAAPSATPRGTPGGLAMPDGFSSLITLASDDDIQFFEKTVQPPGMDGGDAIETTTMHNTAWRTLAARSLKTLTDVTATVAYDPAVLDSGAIQAAINREDTITVTFSDGSTIAFYGYLRTFEPSEMEEGAQPEATVTITPTNVDPSDFSEAGPTIVEVAGTP